VLDIHVVPGFVQLIWRESQSDSVPRYGKKSTSCIA